jgi:hypothetical protein
MTLNNQNLPYKKPILKNQPGIYVNARGVLQELQRDHGGLTEIRSSTFISDANKKHMMIMAGRSSNHSTNTSLRSNTNLSTLNSESSRQQMLVA